MFVKFDGGTVVTAVAILSKLYVIYTNVNVFSRTAHQKTLLTMLPIVQTMVRRTDGPEKSLLELTTMLPLMVGCRDTDSLDVLF